MKLKEEFAGRGMIDQVSREDLWDLLEKEKMDFYMGHDPTFRSLQLGNLFAVMTMRRLQQRGHRPWVVIGSATSMIGDPSGKNTERPLLSREEIVSNGEHIKNQLAGLLDFQGDNAAVIVDNYDWMGDHGYLKFLRDIGKRFRLGDMLAKESVRSRLNTKEGMSYTEFSYQILQAYDFAWLYKNKGVRLQMGGSDQWGNITAGIDLTRKLYSGDVYALTFPLVTDHLGKKFGKSEKGAVFLDRQLTSPYQLFQYLLNVDDRKVGEYLKFFTQLTLPDINTIIREHNEKPEKRLGQKRLAAEIVKLVYGHEGLQEALQATRFFFGESLGPLKDQDVEHIFSHLPSVELPPLEREGVDLLELLAATPLFNSKGEARRGLQQRGVYINNRQIPSEKTTVLREDLISESCLILRKGKKNYALVRFKNKSLPVLKANSFKKSFPPPSEIIGKQNVFALHSDGACRGNPGPGAWGILGQGSKGEVLFESAGVETSTTNNRMELEGAIKALKEFCAYAQNNNLTIDKIFLFSDSKYVLEGITKWVPDWKRRGWKKADKKTPINIDLWQQLNELIGTFQKGILHFRWVKGHSGNPQNEHVDSLANKALDKRGY